MTFFNIYFLNIELILFCFINIFVIMYFVEKLIYKSKFSSNHIFFILVILSILLYHLIFNSIEVPANVFFFYNYFIYSDLIIFLKEIMIFALFLYFILVFNFNEITEIPIFEYCLFVLIAFWSLLILMSSNHLFVIFLFLELVNLCLYCLIGLNKSTNFGIEAAFKYFIQSSLVTILGFFGISLIYISSGTLFINELALIYNIGNLNSLSVIGLFLIILSLFFKLGMFPLHSWLPDIYQGSLLITAAFIAIIPKVAYFIVFFRLITEFNDLLLVFSFIIGLISIIYGSIISLYQTTYRRLIAYGSMVHLGFIIISLCLVNIYSITAAFFYLIIYIFLTLFNFTIMLFFFEKNNNTIYFLDDLSRLNLSINENKLMLFFFSLILFSFAGLPLFMGFLSKWYIFVGFLNKGFFIELLLILIVSVLSSVYYIRVIRFFFFMENKALKIKQFFGLKYHYSLYYLIVFLFILNIFLIFFHNPIYIYILKLIIKWFI
jgi:NADH-quinone oxidoreductase subunit N